MKTKVTKTRWFAVLITLIMLLTVSCEGPEGPEGPAGPIGPKGEQGIKGDKGDEGEMGNANVKYTEWIAFATQVNWAQRRPDFALFLHCNDIFQFSAQTIKDITDGKYVSLCYIKNTNHYYTWNLPAFLAVSDFTEFGPGRKMLNYATYADGTNFCCEINVTSTDGTAVTGAQGNWYYQLLFIRADGGVLKSTVSSDAFKEELQQLSYEEVCQRYGIEP